MRKSWPVIVVASLALGGCAADPGQGGSPSPLPPEPSASSAVLEGPVQPVGEPVTIATGLDAPWSMVPLAGGSILVSERDSARITEVSESGQVREVGTIDGVVPGGEGGLLGLAVLGREAGGANGSDAGTGSSDPTWLYAYFTAADDNRIERMPLLGTTGDYTLGAAEPVLDGLAKAGNHNGGRIAFGPDGDLYATVGDAGQPDRAQDPKSLGGKILRMSPTGAIPDDNPFPGSLVYTLGHRNPQGLAWGADGTMWASEFGQNTWDELNIISAGQNYGWPDVEGAANVDGFVNPVQQWETDEASPSGIAVVGDTVFTASLRGARVWGTTTFEGGLEDTPYFVGEFGRIRDVTAGPDGTLLILTNNTDGRGSPGAGDDRLIEVRLAPLTGP
ncbi:MAG: PQQ-dependent sugar dehydrogenase [Burkholderiaceae bacterium]|nr:PQQ-dependent sugar dehydrogenase [Microbacteriaceae bacterium]